MVHGTGVTKVDQATRPSQGKQTDCQNRTLKCGRFGTTKVHRATPRSSVLSCYLSSQVMPSRVSKPAVQVPRCGASAALKQAVGQNHAVDAVYPCNDEWG